MDLILGIDIGTTGIKAVAFDYEGQPQGIAYFEHKTQFPHSGWAEQDPNEWWNVLVVTLHKLFTKVSPGNVKAIGVTSQQASPVMLDKNNNVLMNSLIWMDKRAVQECKNAQEILTKEELYKRNGTVPDPMYVVYKLAWIKNNNKEVFEQIDTVLQPKDYINLKLTGVRATDYTCAASVHAFELSERKWYKEELNCLGIDEELFPRIVDATEPIGTITKDIAEEFGLSPDTIVVAGGGDTTVSSLGCGMVQEGDVSVVIGTSSDVAMTTESPILDAKQRFGCYPFFEEKKYMAIAGGNSGGSALKWIRDTMFVREKMENPDEIYDLMLKNIEKIPIGSNSLVFLPYLSGERSPIYNPLARGLFVGLELSHTRDHLVRAVIEGISLGIFDRIHAIEEAGGCAKRIIIAGGGAKNESWRQIITDMVGKPTYISTTEEATALGAAILAAVGAKVYSSVSEACSSMASIGTELLPNANTKEQYYRLYEVFKKSYYANVDIFNDIAAL